MGFEKDPVAPNIKIVTQDPLEEIDLRDGISKRPIYISVNLSPEFKVEVIKLLEEYNDYFAWDYMRCPNCIGI